MASYLEHPPQWMPTQALSHTVGLDPQHLAVSELPSEFSELVSHFLGSGVSEINNYIGYPAVQRSIAEEMATSHLAQKEEPSTEPEPPAQTTPLRTHYVATSEPMLFHITRTYGADSEHFKNALDRFELTDHVSAIKRAIESPHFRQSDAQVALRAIGALTASVREQANDAETLLAMASVDSLA